MSGVADYAATIRRAFTQAEDKAIGDLAQAQSRLTALDALEHRLAALATVAEAARLATEVGFNDVVGYLSCEGCRDDQAETGEWWQARTGHDEDCPRFPFEQLAAALAALDAPADA